MDGSAGTLRADREFAARHDRWAMETMTLISRYSAVEPYRGSPDKLRQVAVAFTGSPRANPDPAKVLLISDPFSQQAFLYEFRAADIVYVEEAPSLAGDGSSVAMVRLWVRKGATALRLMPFHVQDTAHALGEYM
jgi:hypothetical protein